MSSSSFIPEIVAQIVDDEGIVAPIFSTGTAQTSLSFEVLLSGTNKGLVNHRGELLITHRKPKALLSGLGKALITHKGKYLMASD